MNVTAIIVISVVVIVLFYVAVTIAIIKKQYKELKNSELKLAELENEYATLKIEFKNLSKSYSKKQEVENETKQNLADIASGTTDDSVDRLQHPEKRRKTKSSSHSKNNSSGV